MIPYPKIDPEILRIGPFSLRWYGLMYLIGFLASYLLVKRRIEREYAWIKKEFVDDLYFFLILGLILGARLGYVIFYNLDYYLKNPLEIPALWHGGMSFHGGLIGSIIAGYFFLKRKRANFFFFADLIIPTVPIGLGLGRIGNFINGELYGRETHLPWGMVFPNAGDVPRHPSQIYEALLEGLFLFLILWFYKEKKRFDGEIFSLFLILYGIFRTFCEFFREPDSPLILLSITRGQFLSLGMILFGLIVFIELKKRRKNV